MVTFLSFSTQEVHYQALFQELRGNPRLLAAALAHSPSLRSVDVSQAESVAYAVVHDIFGAHTSCDDGLAILMHEYLTRVKERVVRESNGREQRDLNWLAPTDSFQTILMCTFLEQRGRPYLKYLLQ